MSIEEELFKRTNVNINKLINYGFVNNNNKYIYTKNILDNTFKVEITIDSKGQLSGKVIDLQINEEYYNIKVLSQNGEFVNKVRNAYKEILIDIKENCYETNYFISKQANIITNYINKKYNDIPEFLWKKFPGFGIFRNKVNKKWYGVIMNIDKSKLDNDIGEVEILNIKLEPNEVKNLLDKKGFYKAYHMNSTSWITIILDDTLKDKEIVDLLDKSYNNVNNK